MNEIIWTIIGTGASVVGLIYAILRNFKLDINTKFDEIKNEMKDVKNEMKDVNSKLNDLDKRLYAVETVLHMKDCCVLKQDQHLKKIE